MKRSRHFLVALLLVVAAPLAAQQQQGTAPASAVSPFDVSNRDTTCAACADFYRFANGGWVSRATIPGAYPMWGTLIQLQESTEKQYRTVVEEAARNVATAPRGSDERKIGALYNACMDSTRIESLGATPLDPALQAIANIRSAKDVAPALVTMEEIAGMAPLSAGEAADFKNSKVMVTQLGQGGLTLPDRDFYFRADQRSAAMRNLLVEHMGKMFQRLGDTPEQAEANAQTVMKFELRLASASMNIAQMRNPAGVYNRMTVDSLERMVPRLQLKKFLAAQGVATKEVVVNQPAFLLTLDSMLVDVPAADWRTYYRWRVVNSAAGALSSPFVNENFAFRRNFSGQREQLPRQRRCLATTNSVLGEAVGREYVKRYFTPEAKASALELIGNLQEVLRERITALDWMSDATKQEALAKLQALTKKIGYPDQWRDYSKLDIRGEFYADLQRARRWSNERNWAKVDKPVDRAEWFVNPQTVDAFYNALNNEIVFPAGILQAPVFDAKADLALNYGAIGAVIGHEMTHGFDDQGRRFDSAGNLRDWWTADDASRYEAKTKLVVDQFNGYTVLDSATHVNGKQTLGENISDLGGLTIAYYAMQKALAKHGRPGSIEGFSPEQRFFLAYANVWRRVARPEYVRQAVNVDVHAPWELRVNGPLSNMPEFRQAWGCAEGDGMVRVDSLRARIW